MPESDKIKVTILPTGTMHADLTRPKGDRELVSRAATSKDATTAATEASRDRVTSPPSGTGTTTSQGTLTP